MIDKLRDRVTYGGNPEHKRNPGDFNLHPPAFPKRDKTLCDDAAIFNRKRALRLLRKGVAKGLFSEQTRNGFPQNVWVVTEEGLPLEAQLENPQQGSYHGYPMPESDPFRQVVLDAWKGGNHGE